MSKKKLVLGEKTLIMGILNITPDSFSDGGKYNSLDVACHHVEEMIRDGADIIDIGGESTRPGHAQISVAEEIDRIAPVVAKIAHDFDILISIDTYKHQVAKVALDEGAHIINDIWGLQYDDGQMAELASAYKVPVIAMHNQNGKVYKGDIIECMLKFFHKTYKIAENYGIPLDKIILDPGIGFGKGYEENIEVLSRLEELRPMGRLLLGTSKKRFLGTIIDDDNPDNRVIATTATTVIGISKGVDIVRVHNVRENKEAAMVADAIYRNNI